MAAICPRWGCLKKRGGWKWEGSLKKPDVIRSPRNKRQKNYEVPVRLRFLGLPINRSRGPPKEISWKVTKDVMQLAIELGHPGRRNFPEVASCY